MIRTKIIATLGPATSEVRQVFDLILSGVDIFRINLSHGEHDSQAALIEVVKEARKKANRETAILLDTRGPEIRVRGIGDGYIDLEEGQKFTLTTEPGPTTGARIRINYDGLTDDVEVGDPILLDDGKLSLSVIDVDKTKILTVVKNGGRLHENKRVSLPGVKINLPPLTDKDISDIRFGCQREVDFIAASFVRKASDVLAVRRVIEEEGGKQHVISKIENQEALDNLSDILDFSDGLMVARGDLGVEIQPENVPVVQKEIIRKANRLGKPVITATQMLESMINNPRPTRAEASDVSNAIFDGTDCVMLSGETAIGSYPLEAVQFLVKTAEVSEAALPFDTLFITGARYSTRTVPNSICYAACAIANDLKANGILVATETGDTARMVSRHRPRTTIIAMSPYSAARRQMQLAWGVTALKVEDSDSINNLFDNGLRQAEANYLLNAGDLAVLLAGIPYKVAGTTNMLKIHEVGDIHIHGQGIGKESVTAKVAVVKEFEELEEFVAGNILVIDGTDNSMLETMSRAAGIITERPGLTSHSAIVGREKNIPVIVGVKDATQKLSTGQLITMNCQHGQIYQAK